MASMDAYVNDFDARIEHITELSKPHFLSVFLHGVSN